MSDENIKAAETATLSCALIDEDAFYDVTSELTSSDFQDERNKMIFDAMMALYNANNVPPNAIDVNNYLETSNNLSKVGIGYIQMLINFLPPTNDLPNYINQVIEASRLRNMKNVLRTQLDAAENGVPDIPSFLEETEKKVIDVLENSENTGFKKSPDIVQEYISNLEEGIDVRRKTGKYKKNGSSTGYSQLDDIIGGFMPGSLLVLAARPGIGKTALALNFASNVAHAGGNVALFSLEMNEEELMGRLLSNRSRLTTREIDDLNFVKRVDSNGIIRLAPDKSISIGNASISNIANFNNAINSINKDPIFINVNPGTTVMKIQGQVKKLMTQLKGEPLSLVVIDYIGLIQSAGSKVNASDNRQNIVSDITRALKRMAMDLKIPVLALSQLNRQIEARGSSEPQLSDLRDSGSIEQDANVVMFIHNPNDTGKNSKKEEQKNDQDQEESQSSAQVKLIVRKNRSGRTGEIDFMFQKDYCRFDPIDEDRSASIPNEEPDAQF